MKLLETPKFQKLRKKLKDGAEKGALRDAVQAVLENPETGKKLKGEFRDYARSDIRFEAKPAV